MKRAAWSAMAGLLFLAAAPRAAEPGASERIDTPNDVSTAQAADAIDAAPLGAEGVRAYIDPATGELIDAPVTPEQRNQAESLALPAPDYSKVTYETKSDGTVVAHGNGQFESTSTIRIDAVGGARIGCTQSGSHEDHVHGAAPEQRP